MRKGKENLWDIQIILKLFSEVSKNSVILSTFGQILSTKVLDLNLVNNSDEKWADFLRLLSKSDARTSKVFITFAAEKLIGNEF